MTGIQVKTIHSGFEPVAMKLSITRPADQLRPLLAFAFAISERRVSADSSKLISLSNRDSASAPMPTSTPKALTLLSKADLQFPATDLH